MEVSAPYILTSPLEIAQIPIASLLSAPVFRLICSTCLATVFAEHPSARAMALFVRPSSAITCTSRGVSW
jgi:hypothetical protein